jgi:uncharacterized protein
MTREEVIELLRERRPYLAAEFGIRRIGLFGSFAQGRPHEDSDVDLVVEFARPIGLQFMELASYLEQVLGKKVDVLTPAGIAGIRSARVAQTIQNSIVYV